MISKLLVDMSSKLSDMSYTQCTLGQSFNNELIDPFTLPKTPSRLIGFETFIIDNPLFIDALAPFKTSTNTNVLTVNNVQLNTWNLGGLVDTTPSFSFTPYTGNPQGKVKPSIEYVASIDAENEYYHNYSVEINNVLSWFKTFSEYYGQVSPLGTIGTITRLSNPPTRNMGVTLFNTSSENFSKSMRDHTQSIRNAQLSWVNVTSGVVDCGRLTESVTEIIDCGRISDSFITN